ncbi:hypothetical protein EUX98_g5138 [Antrodiella citrinella]|uniref:Copper transporter n=1 Tax=Antrodiella citrinella TaxID=2447956 RepID=A0A4S4MUS8_9APHY|nr:hypothetical protein EUX98_g5138 [Antrodiella citrinella]
MIMDGWQDHLHFELGGEHVLLPSLHLDSAWHFFLGGILTVTLCLFERALTFAISKHWCPLQSIRRSRLRKALWNTSLYWIVTLGRLLYMLIAMTNNMGLILVATTALSIGQFVIHYLEDPRPEYRSRNPRDPENIKEPLLDSPRAYNHSLPLRNYSVSSIAPPYHYHSQHSPVSPDSSTSRNDYVPYHEDAAYVEESTTQDTERTFSTHLRSKSKPMDIFIHPAESNLARADAAAQHLGVGGDTERVRSHQYPTVDDDDDIAWEAGRGRDVARELLGSASRKNTKDYDLTAAPLLAVSIHLIAQDMYEYTYGSYDAKKTES